MATPSFDTLRSSLARSRRTLLGAALAGAGAAAGAAQAAGKKKKKKKCKAPTTKCGKKACCQPGQTCADGVCATPATTTPKPLTSVQCPGPRDIGNSGSQRMAQTFVANGTGQIATASFDVSNTVVNTAFSVEIRPTQQGLPSSSVLGTAVVFNIPPIGGTPETITATFDPKVPVQEGVTYALVITDVAKKAFIIGTRNPGVCPGATVFSNAGDNVFTPMTQSLIFTVSP
ncbi:MAG: hypothetical protein QM692_16520 [Thermomicrobiales bacterium]